MPAIKIKPLSVNESWQGRRYKTQKYKTYASHCLMLLPKKIDIPNTKHYRLVLGFAFSSTLSDWDNPVKPFQDILQKKYGFNDKLIKNAEVFVELVPKGEEFIAFKLEPLPDFDIKSIFNL